MDIEIKEPTVGDMVKIAPILTDENTNFPFGEDLIRVLVIVTNANKEQIMQLNPERTKELLGDFFDLWNPLKWISENTEMQMEYVNSLQLPETVTQTIEKRSGQK